MPDIIHALPIKAAPHEVFAAVSTPRGLDAWWSIESKGEPEVGNEYELDFGPGYLWRCVVKNCVPPHDFEIEMTESDDDWTGTTIRFHMDETDSGTLLRFAHLGWPLQNDHYQTSSYCWAMYLRCLKRYIEHGVILPYQDRFHG